MSTKITRGKTKTDLDNPNTEKKSGDSSGFLASFLRKVFADNGINSTYFHYLMEEWLNDPVNQIPNNVKDRASARGNLTKEMLNNRVTWRTFFKALQFLQTEWMKLSIEIKLPGKKPLTTTLEAILKQPDILEGIAEEVEGTKETDGMIEKIAVKAIGNRSERETAFQDFDIRKFEDGNR